MNSKKKLLAVLAAAAIPAVSAWSQDWDRIILHSGDTIKCNVMELSSAEVKFRYPAETLVNVEKMVQVRRIELASGRVVEGGEIRPVLSEADWERVIVTGDESKADGLKYVATIKAKSSVWRSLKETESDKAFVELKQEAARHQCHLVVLVGGYTMGANMLTGQNDMEVRANIYTYPFIEKLLGKGTSALLDEVKEKPLGSYDRRGYKEYRSIMDDIEVIDKNTAEDKMVGISDRIAKYRAVADACPDTEQNDRGQFDTACCKLEKAFAKMCKKFNVVLPEHKEELPCQDIW